MFPDQWILRLGVIEALAETGGDNLLPTCRRVAGLATLLSETAFMRIGMAVITFREGKSHVARLLVRPRRMALLALYLCVLSGQGIASLGMIERARNIFPVREIVTGRAIRSQPSAMRVFMASGACLC